MTVIIDTREQNPWAFPPTCNVKFEKLEIGDYALEGDEAFSLERKNLDDFVQQITSNWNNQIRRNLDMVKAGYAVKIIIVESSFQSIVKHHYTSSVQQRFVIKRMAELIFENVHVIFCENAQWASGMAHTLLKRRYNQLESNGFLQGKEEDVLS